MKAKNIKYTTEGKKVVVLGSLNSQESIVQEIFLIDGKEIPSGENFVVKSLHDAPAISWKEKNLKEIEARYDTDKKNYENEIDNLRKRYRNECNLLREKLNYVGLAFKKADKKNFELFVNYICGKITHVVINQWSEPQLITFEEFHQQYEDKLRLISLYGKDDGTFSYAIGDYNDYSGGHKHFSPFTNYDDAFEKFKYFVLESEIKESIIKLARTHKIKLDKDKMFKYKEKCIKENTEHIASYQKQILTCEESIKNIENI